METRQQRKQELEKKRGEMVRLRQNPSYRREENERKRQKRVQEREEIAALRARVEELEAQLARYQNQQVEESSDSGEEGEESDDEDYGEEVFQDAVEGVDQEEADAPAVIEEEEEEVRLNKFGEEVAKNWVNWLGVSAALFDELVVKVQREMPKFKKTGSPRKRHTNTLIMTMEEAKTYTVFTLFWLRMYYPQVMAGLLFDVAPRTFMRMVRRGISCMASFLAAEIVWPSDEEFHREMDEWNSRLPGGLKNCVCVVDGSEWRIRRPRTNQHLYYSAKKKQHSINILFICWLSGMIFYKSPYAKGAHDQREWNTFRLRERFVGKEYGILGDGGFYFNRANDDDQIVAAKPFKKKRGEQLTQEQKEFNKKFSQFRVVVENAIGQLKKWKVFSEKFRHYRDNKTPLISPNDIMTVVVALTNRKIKERPLRGPNWQPPQKDPEGIATGDADTDSDNNESDEE
jgi:hypothetical protein